MNIYTTQDERQLSADPGKYLTQAIAGLEDKQRVLCKIVHLPLSESIGDWEEIGEDRANEIRAAKGQTTAAIDMTHYNQQQKLMTMAINTMPLTDEQAIEVKDLYPRWEDLIGTELAVGYKFQYSGQLYKVLQAHTAQEDWKPGTDTAALYALVGQDATEPQHAGTREDPIPYEQMMLIEKDKYYTQDGQLYLGLMDAPSGYPNDLKDLPTLAQAVQE